MLWPPPLLAGEGKLEEAASPAPWSPQKSLTRPFRSQSPKRVGSGPSGPPISVGIGFFGVGFVSSGEVGGAGVSVAGVAASCPGFVILPI